MRARFNKLKEKAKTKGIVLEDCFVSKFAYRTFKKEENHWDCLLWKTLDDVDDALDNVEAIEDMNFFKNR
tara:strand:- start:152 stop:361 length:210 start_codon:yes stop_codon:yes gene_type:complete